jgi:hypothetical protein
MENGSGIVPVNRDGTTGGEPFLDAHRLMRTAVIVGPVCSVLCIVMGALQFVQGHGIVIFTIGCVLSVFWIIMIPSRRRSGKR